MRLSKSITNQNRKIVGFMLEGKETEFGGFTSREMEKPIRIEEMISRRFRNNQVSVVNNNIVEIGKFRIYDLPMLMLKDDNFKEIDNEINLMTRIIQADKLIGFKVRFGDGTLANYTYSDVIRLARWFRPANFTVRSTESKVFIAGKPGVLQLDTLPEEVLISDKEKKDAQVKTNEAEKNKQATKIQNPGAERIEVRAKVLERDLDILDLYQIVLKDNGYIIKLPDEKYKKTNTYGTKYGEDFKELHIGELGSPFVQFSEKNINVTTNFNKMGIVNVNLDEKQFPMYTYINSKKTIFMNGENHIKRFAIAVSPECIDIVKGKFSEILAVRDVLDKKMLRPIIEFTGKKDLRILEVDTTKLALISPDKAKKHILSDIKLKESLEQLMHAKIQNKYLNGVLKDTQLYAHQNAIVLEDRVPFGLFNGMTPVQLKVIHEAGIDIFSGAFYKIETSKYGTDDEKTGADTIEIEYGIKGLDPNKLTYAGILNKERNKLMDEYLINMVESLESIDTAKEKFVTAKEIKKTTEALINALKMTLWMHKVSMFTLHDGKIHTHDRDMWIENVNSRVKGNVYDCVAPGCDGMFLILRGTTL